MEPATKSPALLAGVPRATCGLQHGYQPRLSFPVKTLLVLFSSLALFCSPALPAEKPNVLFIPVDDLNHWVGHLGRNAQSKTPNLDRLAKMGVTFTNAHCAAPVCNPSRTALLSGLRPSTTGIYDNGVHFSKGAGVSAEGSLVMQFKKAGYKTLGMGKLWHGGLGFAEQWSETGPRERRAAQGKVEDRSIGGIKFGVLKGGDEAVPDTAIADYAIAELGKKHEQPFFLVPGFHKPHMPWYVPQKYYDMHPLDKIELPPTKEGDLEDVPAAGVKMAQAMRDHARVRESGRWKEAVQAYLAAISYLDEQIGRVLDALEKSAYKDNTIICLWGDHGWHLGEKEHWRKFSLWEEATRAPFIWVVPGVTKPGGVCARPVDFMSIYPTLCDVAGIEKPAHVTGSDIRPLLADPGATWTTPALTTHGANNHAVRTERWRFIRYADGSEELYDHAADKYEWGNLAGKPEHAEVKTELAAFFPTENVPELTGKADADSAEDVAATTERKAKRAKRRAQRIATPVEPAKQ
jgi:arylsulfatase A-like enzyme